MSTCDEKHPETCVVERSAKLIYISLIDVESRTVVQCPDMPCDYLALSYVWGLQPQASVTTGTMSNLSRSIWTQKWGTRASTLQEAVLSPSCIYFGDQQVYFECNGMQCCESLDESKSWMHQVVRDAHFQRTQHSDATVGGGVLRRPTLGKGRIIQYGTLVSLFSRRYMSDQSDGLNALGGIMQYFRESHYGEGFFWGLPVEDLNWALCWMEGPDVLKRRGNSSWSWAGWQGHV